MSVTDPHAEARALLLRFARRSGLSPPTLRPQRYLWTDAHAVTTWLLLAGADGAPECERLALALVDQVHAVLGRHRADDARSGFLSGLDEHAARAHPTAGGLRIGKPLPERAPGEPLDERAEWDRDGQYFHYLTRWMAALSDVTRHTGDPRPLGQALELADVACTRFLASDPVSGRACLHWKMSVDLTRPLVAGGGSHDPLDGFVTLARLRAEARAHPERASWPSLDGHLTDLRAMLSDARCVTDDALGIGGLLSGAGTLAALHAAGESGLRDPLALQLESAAVGLLAYARARTWLAPAARRLAFRELGLVLGLATVPRLALLCGPLAARPLEHPRLDALFAALHEFVPLGRHLLVDWCRPENRDTDAWHAHRDIDEVMLAHALVGDVRA